MAVRHRQGRNEGHRPGSVAVQDAAVEIPNLQFRGVLDVECEVLHAMLNQRHRGRLSGEEGYGFWTRQQVVR